MIRHLYRATASPQSKPAPADQKGAEMAGKGRGLLIRSELQIGEEKIVRCVMPTRSYLSQVELPITFGLGTRSGPGTLRIKWPGGAVQEEPITIDPGVNRLDIRQSTPETPAK